MEPALDLYHQALEIIKKSGAGSVQYAEFLARVREGKLAIPHGVVLPRYVPGDIRGLKRRKSRKGGSASSSPPSPKAAGLGAGSSGMTELVLRRKKTVRDLRSSVSCCGSDLGRGQGGGLVRTVSETLLIEGLQPVVITRQKSVGKEEVVKSDEHVVVDDDKVDVDALGDVHEKKGRGVGRGKTLSMSVMPDVQLGGIKEVDEEERQEVREVVDQFKAVLLQKARAEGTLTEEQKRNEALKQEYESLMRQHGDMKKEQEMMNEQVANQLQHLLKEKSHLMEQNHQLQAENGNLKVLLDLATAEPESDDEYWEKANMETEHATANPLHEISAWHPAKSPGGSSSGELISFPDENDMNADPADPLSVKIDRIAISS